MVFDNLHTNARTAAGLAALLTLGLGQSAAAVENADFRFDTTKELYNVCSVPADAPEYPMARQACRAFVEGAAQYHDEVSKPGKLKRLVCFPPNATIEDGVTAFNAWAATKAGDAQSMGAPPVLGLIHALAAKYPCKG